MGVRILLFLGVLFAFQSPLHADMVGVQACTFLFESSKTSTALKQNTKLKIASWNIGHNSDEERSPNSILDMGAVLRDVNADIYIFQEVMGAEDLQNIVSKALANDYEPHLIRGNDMYGVEIGFAVRKGLDISVVLETNAHLRWTDPNTAKNLPAFSRDLPVLYVRQNDGRNIEANDAPDIIVLGAHLKSPRGKNVLDPNYNNYRTAQALQTVEVMKELQVQHPGVPIILGGDFNGDIPSAPELSSLKNSFMESLALMGNKLSRDQKVTNTYHPGGDSRNEGHVVATQADGLYINFEMAKKLVQAFVYHYKNIAGHLYPQRKHERDLNPSDHMPVVGVYDMTRH